MRATGIVCLAVLACGCSLVYPTNNHQGGDGPDATSDGGDAGDGGSVDAGGDGGDGGPCADSDHDHDFHLSIICGGDDCDDDDSSVHPGAPQICGNVKDDTCGDTGLQQAFGVAGHVTRFDTRTLFTYAPPTVDGASLQLRRLSATSTNSNGGWFLFAGVESVFPSTEVFIWTSSRSDPAAYSAIGEQTPLRPAGGIVSGIALGRNEGAGEADVDVTWILRTPDTGTSLSGHVGTINASGSGPALVTNSTITGPLMKLFRPGIVMTDSPPRWVIGEVNPPSGTDVLSSCVQANASSCTTVGSTLSSLPSTVASELAGSASGHVFFRTADGALGRWDTQSASVAVTAIDAYTSPGSVIRSWPSVATIGPVVGAPAVYRHLISLPYTDSSLINRVTLLRADCIRGTTPGACAYAIGLDLSLDVGESFAGPAAVVAYGTNHIMVVTGVRDATSESVRAFLGTYNFGNGSIQLTHTETLTTYALGASSLADVTATFVAQSGEPSAISIVWQRDTSSPQIQAAGFTYCEAL